MEGDASFGHWLRLRRKTLRLSCVEVARRVGCATITLRKIEADERRPSEQIAEKLAEHLTVAPQERLTFVKVARGELGVHWLALPEQIADRPALTAGAPLRTKVPIPLAPLIGRAEDVTAIRVLLLGVDVRLVTLTGAPGIGKTRLALQVATELHDAFADGVAFIPLAPIRDPALVLVTIAQTLEIGELPGQPLLEWLQTYLRARQMLLVLDNVEQVLKAAPELALLLTAAPRLTLLVTSRVALHLSGEQRFAVPPLALPPSTLPDDGGGLGREWEALTQYAAVELFVQRAHAALPTFVLTATNAQAVTAICRRLDGLPLAIALAAARIALFTPSELLERLDQRLTLLTTGAVDLPTRQQTLRRAIDWSYELLDEDEQTLFRRLGVFAGGCTLDAVELVCNPTGDVGLGVVERVAALIDKSLLQREEGIDGRSRFTMLETIREYALERLELSGEAVVLRRRHAEHYLAWAKAAESDLYWPMEAKRLDQLAAEYNNLRAVLEWSCTDQGDVEVGLRVVAALPEFWIVRGLFSSEGRAWFARVLERCGDGESSLMEARAKALLGFGQLEWTQGEYARSSELLEQSLALYRELGNRSGEAQVLLHQGRAAYTQGDYDHAAMLEEQSLALFQGLGDHKGITWAFLSLGDVALGRGDTPRAAVHFQEARLLSTRLGESVACACALYNLGYIAFDQGNDARAETFFTESLRLFRNEGLDLCIAICLVGIALVAEAQGRIERAARLSGVVATMHDSLSSVLDPIDRAHYESAVTMVRAHLDEAAFAAAWATGQAMSLEQAVAYALEA
jgi:predicted ATPase/transcriptional regulator with XRE-family HTH domain